MLGDVKGCLLGVTVGCFLGDVEGRLLGAVVGCLLGEVEDWSLGAIVGCLLGNVDSCLMGSTALHTPFSGVSMGIKSSFSLQSWTNL